MFSVSQIRQLDYPSRLKGSNGCFAKGSADSTSVSIYIQKKIKGDRNSKTRKLATLYKFSGDLKKDLREVEQKAIQWNIWMDEGKDPKYITKDNNFKDTITLNELLNQYEKSRIVFDTGNAPKTMSDRRNTIKNVFSNWLQLDIKLITKQMCIDKYDQYTQGNTNNVTQTKMRREMVRGSF